MHILSMSAKHAIFDNAGYEYPRLYTREECKKIECPKYMSKMTIPGKYVPEVDIRDIYTGVKGPYVFPVRYAHEKYAHTGYPQWMSMHLQTYSMSAVPMTAKLRS